MGKKGQKSLGKQKKEIDPLQLVAEKMRRHKELESRWALLAQQETRVEYIRGKDLAAFLRSHPEMSTAAIQAGGSHDGHGANAGPPEEQVVELLMEKQLLLRCDRVVKTVRQGKKKLSKWPAKLDVHPEQEFTEDDGFYAWTFEMRTTFFMAFMSALVPLLTLAACLFPVFPRWAKLGVLWTCISLLSTIFVLLFVRAIVFSLIWLATGKQVWFFPNLFSEDVNTLTELFEFKPTPDKDPRAKWTTRLAVAAVAAFVLWACFRHVPDEKQRAAFRVKAKNKIDEWLAWNPAREALSSGDVSVGMNATRNATANTTASASQAEKERGPGSTAGSEGRKRTEVPSDDWTGQEA